MAGMPQARHTLRFTKLTGAGNDFVLIDNRTGRIRNAPALARHLCDRRFGVGADGLLLIERSRTARYRMKYYNADGSHGGMCGNGGRCIARYAVARRIAPARHTFEALGHVYTALVRSKSVTLLMKDVQDTGSPQVLDEGGGRWEYVRLDTGSPHIVLPVPQEGLKSDFADLPVRDLGRTLRRHVAFQPVGTNVNFVERVSAKCLRMRTYERGVEQETLACGTGSIACALTGHRLWGMHSPVSILTAGGSTLRISFRLVQGVFRDIRLTGPAEIVFEGTVHG